MPPAGADPRLQRALAMQRAMHVAAASRVAAGPWGDAFLTPARPLCHQDNLVWAAPGAAAATLAEASERLLPHDDVVVLTAPDPAAGLARRGFAATPECVLVVDAAPDRDDPAGAREVELADVLPSMDVWLATDTVYGRDPEVRAQLLEHHRTFGAAGAQERVFGVVEDDVVLAWAKLWRRDGVAQVEDVVVLPSARGRGLGRGVVTAALRAAAGEELVFLVALEEDWPRRLYAKLGFRPVGGLTVCTRPRERR